MSDILYEDCMGLPGRYRIISHGNNVAIIGASQDRTKYSNKAVRAFLEEEYYVYPVNPKGGDIDNILVYETLDEIVEKIDFASIYMCPEKVLEQNIIKKLKQKGVGWVILNPGFQDDNIIKKLNEYGVNYLLECSIQGLGKNPKEL